MPTDEERREYPHMTDADWEGIEKLRALKARGEWPYEPGAAGLPSFEEQVLTLLREQSELLREIRDRLRSPTAGRSAEGKELPPDRTA
jgi:hypothetical protein